MQNNFFLELIPLIVFFVIYYVTKDIFFATGFCIAASWCQLLLYKIKFNHISKNTWISTILITVFGGLTVILHNKTFVMLKPTVLFWLIGISLLIGQAIGKNMIKLTFNKEVDLSERIWNRLNIAWGLYFIFLGILNLFIAFNFSEYMWVKFKVFGSLTLTFIFTLICIVVVSIYRKKA